MIRNTVTIYLFCIMCFIAIFGSCKNRAQEELLRESCMRLEQQNEAAQNLNRNTEHTLTNIVLENYTAKRYEYLQPAVKNFTENAQQLRRTISQAAIALNALDSAALFHQYQILQISYKNLKQKLTDSFKYIIPDTNINNFMNLNQKAFVQKYFSVHDSSSLKLHLLFLQTDASLNEKFFVELLVNALTPSWNFDPISAIGRTDKLIYQRGEKLKLTAVLARYYPSQIEYATINNKRIELKDNFVEYSKKITEKPGIHTLHIKVFTNKNGLLEVYPAEVTYKVE